MNQLSFAPSPPRLAAPLSLVPQSDPVADLTPREREVLGLIAEGLDNAAICSELWISAKTLERHVQNVFAKLELPPACGRHRRVCAVLAYLRSPLSRPTLEPVATAAPAPQRTLTAGPASPRNFAR